MNSCEIECVIELANEGANLGLSPSGGGFNSSMVNIAFNFFLSSVSPNICFLALLLRVPICTCELISHAISLVHKFKN